MFRTDICIAGAGIIGLSLALELHLRGLRVVVLEAGDPMQQASTAAAGMLAAGDPHNPPELSPLAHLSLALYPAFIHRLASLGGIAVPFQTTHTLQSLHSASELHAERRSRSIESISCASSPEDITPPSRFHLLRERSLDPRQLASSLLAAVGATSIELLSASPVLTTTAEPTCVRISTPSRTLEAAHFIDCTGAWASDPAFAVRPVKGQMLAVALPYDLPLALVVRTRDLYIVPRTVGPHAGRAIIGATIEDAGFDKTAHAAQIDALHRQAAELLPSFAQATVLESWSGLRPATPDRLPILGAHPSQPHHWVATGHYRNGILLAPATARVLTQCLLDEVPSVDLDAFSSLRPALRPAP